MWSEPEYLLRRIKELYLPGFDLVQDVHMLIPLILPAESECHFLLLQLSTVCRGHGINSDLVLYFLYLFLIVLRYNDLRILQDLRIGQ